MHSSSGCHRVWGKFLQAESLGAQPCTKAEFLTLSALAPLVYRETSLRPAGPIFSCYPGNALPGMDQRGAS